jgi:hypothetical protein
MRQQITQLSKTINSRNNLKNMYQAKQLMNLGLFEQAAKIQQPITNAIAESSKETKSELERVRNAISNQPQQLAIQSKPLPAMSTPLIEDPDDIEILNIINNETETTPRLTNNTLTLVNIINGVKAFIIGSGDKKILFGLKNTTLINIESKEEYRIPSVGVAKLLFQSKPTENRITKEDVDEYKSFLDRYNFNISQDSKRKIILKHYPNKTTRRKYVFPEYEGDGVNNASRSEQTIDTVLIPSDPNKLREALLLQLADCQAGNNNNFNHVNAIMKKLLSQKIITAKDYRKILSLFSCIKNVERCAT